MLILLIIFDGSMSKNEAPVSGKIKSIVQNYAAKHRDVLLVIVLYETVLHKQISDHAIAYRIQRNKCPLQNRFQKDTSKIYYDYYT